MPPAALPQWRAHPTAMFIRGAECRCCMPTADHDRDALRRCRAVSRKRCDRAGGSIRSTSRRVLLLVALFAAVPFLTSRLRDFQRRRRAASLRRTDPRLLRQRLHRPCRCSASRTSISTAACSTSSRSLLGRILPVDIYVIRHVLCALIGIGGIAAAWATARLIAGPRAGAVRRGSRSRSAARGSASMFNHTKDIPFAAAMMGATYFLLRAARDLPRPRLHASARLRRCCSARRSASARWACCCSSMRCSRSRCTCRGRSRRRERRPLRRALAAAVRAGASRSAISS